MRYDPILEEKFTKAFNKLLVDFKRKNSNNLEELEEILSLIKDEKVIYHRHELALEKIIRLEKLLKDNHKIIPNELKYRKAAIHLEFEKDFDEAEKLFIELINTPKVENCLKERGYYLLSKLYIDLISTLEDDENDSREEALEKAKKALNYLLEKADKLDEYVKGSLWDLRQQISNLETDKEFEVLKIPTNNKTSFRTITEALNLKNNFDIFIDNINMHIFIKGKEVDFSPNDIKLIIMMIKGSDKEKCKHVLNLDSDNTFHQRIKRLRSQMKELEIKTLKSRYKFTSNITIALLYKKDDKYDLSELIELY